MMRRFFIKFFVPCLLIIAGTIVPILIFEIGIRIEHLYRKGTPFFASPSARWDKTLGWVGREQKIGPESSNPVLVIGDSFTDGLTVERDKMWYAYLKPLFPDQQIIANGALGYGSLQELLVLKKYLSSGIHPSAIIIQLCTNDIINNYYPLERESFLQRPPAPRPYLEDSVIRIKFPRAYGDLLMPLISYSRIAARYSMQWDLRIARRAEAHEIESVEYRIQRIGFKYPLFREAIGVTDTLIGQIKDTAGNIPLVFMLIDNGEPYSAAFRGIAKGHHVSLIIPQRRAPVPDTGKLEDGAHLNEAGNKLLGETFRDILQEQGIFATATRTQNVVVLDNSQ